MVKNATVSEQNEVTLYNQHYSHEQGVNFYQARRTLEALKNVKSNPNLLSAVLELRSPKK